MHDLTQTARGYEVFTAKEKPWHGLGVFVKEAQTSEEAIKLAKLSWLVHQSPVQYKGGGFTQEVPTSKVNWRILDGVPTDLGIVSNSYGVVQNHEAFEFFDEIVGSKEAIFETAGSLRGGKVVFITAKFPAYITVKGDDSLTELYCVLSMGHDGKTSIQVLFTPIRVVCNNTLLFARTKAKIRLSIPHTKNANERLQQAATVLGIKNQFISEFRSLAEDLQETKVDDLFAMRESYRMLYGQYPGDRTSRAELERIDKFMDYYRLDESQRGIGGTAWGLVNAMSAYAQHEVAEKSRIPGRAMETIIKNGARWKRLQKTVNLLA